MKLYEEHFLPHGVTPKQFEKVLRKATKLEVPKDYVILRQGQKVDTVTLVYKGGTCAISTAQRRVTAASSEPTLAKILVGGNAGAWIGEIHFLEVLAAQETGRFSRPRNENGNYFFHKLRSALSGLTSQNLDKQPSITVSPRPNVLTYKTTKDSTLLQWTFDDLAQLLDSGSDMRSNMTRAMTAAVVGKVVNYTVDKSNEPRPNWMSWLTGGSTFNHKYRNDNVYLLENVVEDDEYGIAVDDQGTKYDGPQIKQLL